jgi:UDP-glucuronate decarboxylase
MIVMETQDHILLTGGTGFFGKALLRHWAAQEHDGHRVPKVTLVSRDPDRFASLYPNLVAHSWLSMHHGDISDARSLPIGTSFSHVLHAAADSTQGPILTPLQRYDQIVNGTRNVLDLAVACGAKRFLLTSSGAVYGVQPAHLNRIPEDWHGVPDPLNPNNAYGIAKRSAEHLCALYGQSYGLQTVIARCFAFVGPDLPLDVHFAIGNFIRDALWREEITVAGDGSPLRSYLDQQDLALWLLVLMEQGVAGQAYNVGSDQPISIADLAHLVRDIVAPRKKVHIHSATNGCNERNIYVPSIQKARNQLGLDVRVSLEKAIKAIADPAMNCISQTSV